MQLFHVYHLSPLHACLCRDVPYLLPSIASYVLYTPFTHARSASSSSYRYDDICAANTAAWYTFLFGSATPQKPDSSHTPGSTATESSAREYPPSLIHRVHSTKRALRLIWEFQREQENPMDDAIELFGKITNSKLFGNRGNGGTRLPIVLWLNKVR